MTTYQMTPIDNGTRLRKDHNTFAAVITSYSKGQLVEGDDLWIAPADGNEVKKGDEWLHVTKVDGVSVPGGWMAQIHKGILICDNFKIVTPDPTPTPTFPESFTLVDPQGNKAEYAFVRILE